MLDRLRGVGPDGLWKAVLVLAFIPTAGWWTFLIVIMPTGLGVHGDIYADATAAWLQGANPWLVGPEDAVFAGPPTMLLPFLPFAFLPSDVNRIAWVVIDLAIAVWVFRRLGLPGYWLAFPPLYGAIILGHIEVLILGAIVLGGPISGLAAVVKPYAALPLLAERRWRALVVAAAAVLVTFPFLPWPQFFAEVPTIAGNLARQDVGDSTFGQLLPMLAGAVALMSLGPRRALWLAVPVFWPHAQPLYKTMTIPVLTPILALFWALPLNGATLVGVVVYAVLVHAHRLRTLPEWLRVGIQPIAPRFPARAAQERLPDGQLAVA